jgi:hypothetical protein
VFRAKHIALRTQNINYHSSNAAVNVDFKGDHNAQKNEERKISIDSVDKMALSSIASNKFVRDASRACV